MSLLYSLIIYSLPFWSLPFLPGTYSSITPYLIALVGVFSIFSLAYNRKVEKGIVVFSFFFTCLFLFYACYSLGLYGLSTIVKIMSYIIGFFSILGFNFLIKEKGLPFVKNKLLHIALFISILALIEVLCVYLNLSSIKSVLNTAFTGGSSAKVILTTSEPSWAVQLLLFCSVILFFDYKISGNKVSLFFLVSNMLIFLMSFSLTGFMVLIFSVVFYVVFFSRLGIWNIFKLFSFISIFLVFCYFSYSYGSEFFGGYTYNRIGKLLDLTQNGIVSTYYTVISIDNSLLVRIGYPIVAFSMMMDYPFGVGIGGFAHHLNEYLSLLSAPNFWNSEVPYHIESLNADTRNYFLTFGTDFGYLGLLFVTGFHLYLLLKIKMMSVDYLFCAALFSLMVGIMLQFSSTHFSIYSLIYSIILVCSEYEKKNINNYS